MVAPGTGVCGLSLRPQLSPRLATDSGGCGFSKPRTLEVRAEVTGLRVVSVQGAGLGGDLEAPPPDRVLTRHGVCPQDPLLRVQEALNGTEVHLQHLTALVDCRSLHLVSAGPGLQGGGQPGWAAWRPAPGAGGRSSMSVSPACLPSPVAGPAPLLRPQDYVQALTGLCYDGVEGLIYLALFSFVTALMFSSVVCSVPHTWQQKR